MRISSLRESAPFIAAGAVLVTSGCAPQLSEPIELSPDNAVYIPSATEVFAGPVLDRSEIDNTLLGKTAQDITILSYELTNDNEVACVKKDTISRDMITEPQSPLYWVGIGRICFSSDKILSSLEGWQVYPEKAY